MKYEYSDEDEERLDKAIDEYWTECGESWERYAELINSLDAPEKDKIYFFVIYAMILRICIAEAIFAFRKKKTDKGRNGNSSILKMSNFYPRNRMNGIGACIISTKKTMPMSINICSNL